MAEKCANIGNDLIHESDSDNKLKELEAKKSEIEDNLKAVDDSLKDIAESVLQRDNRLEGQCGFCKESNKIRFSHPDHNNVSV